MGLFNFLKPNRDNNALMRENIDFNVDKIMREERKSLYDAQYLAICLTFDYMEEQKSRDGYAAAMDILQRYFPQHVNHVFMYLGWKSGELQLNDEAEEALLKRHASG